MKANHYLPEHLETTVRWALCQTVDEAEPSPIAWRRIRQRIQAGDGESSSPSAWAWLKMRPGRQILLAGLVFVGVGLGLSLSLPPAHESWGPWPEPTSPAEQRLVSTKGEGTLNGRLLWLAKREERATGVERARHYLE